MIEGPDWLFVENPKTGSSAMSRALRYMGGEVTKTKHQTLMDSQTAAGKTHKFCFVRNPWDRMVSAWAYNTKGKDLSFEDWLTGDRWDAGIGFDIKRCPQICWAFRCSKSGAGFARALWGNPTSPWCALTPRHICRTGRFITLIPGRSWLTDLNQILICGVMSSDAF